MRLLQESSFKLTRAQEEDPQSLLPGASEAEPEVIDLVKSQSNVATLAPESVGETVAKELVRRDLTEKEAQTEVRGLMQHDATTGRNVELKHFVCFIFPLALKPPMGTIVAVNLQNIFSVRL